MDKELYDASVKALIEHGVPPQLAAQASEVVATDEVGRERTPEQQHIVTSAWYWMNATKLKADEILRGK